MAILVLLGLVNVLTVAFMPAGRWVLGTVYVVALGGVALHGIAL